jgi:hypothetical protein
MAKQERKSVSAFGETVAPEAALTAKELACMKLSEAVALCGMGAELLQKHEQILSKIMDQADLDYMYDRFTADTNRSRAIAEQLADPAEVNEQVELADRKFTDMHNSFMRGETEAPLAVIAWLGIASAGGIGIWTILESLGAEIGDRELEKLSQDALKFQKQNLMDGEQALRKLAVKPV